MGAGLVGELEEFPDRLQLPLVSTKTGTRGRPGQARLGSSMLQHMCELSLEAGQTGPVQHTHRHDQEPGHRIQARLDWTTTLTSYLRARVGWGWGWARLG